MQLRASQSMVRWKRAGMNIPTRPPTILGVELASELPSLPLPLPVSVEFPSPRVPLPFETPEPPASPPQFGEENPSPVNVPEVDGLGAVPAVGVELAPLRVVATAPVPSVTADADAAPAVGCGCPLCPWATGGEF